jgi:hypothetical protein
VSELAPNWDDVLARAHRARRRQRRQAFVVAAVAAFMLVGTAVAMQIADAFRGTQPPPRLRARIARIGPPPKVEGLMSSQDPHVIRERIHGVLQLRIGRAKIQLWAAPLSNGGRCLAVTTNLESSLTGLCNMADDGDPPVNIGGFYLGWDVERSPLVEAGAVLVPGKTVDFVLDDGRVVSTRVIEDAVLAQMPTGHRPITIIVRDRRGVAVATYSLEPRPRKR